MNIEIYRIYILCLILLFQSFPLDMSQFENLFHSTRIPMIEQDRLQKFETARHILMMKRGNFYVFDLFDENGEP